MNEDLKIHGYIVIADLSQYPILQPYSDSLDFRSASSDSIESNEAYDLLDEHPVKEYILVGDVACQKVIEHELSVWVDYHTVDSDDVLGIARDLLPANLTEAEEQSQIEEIVSLFR